MGAEALVRGASGLAARLGISPLVIGLTVVAFATSAPELVVGAVAAVRRQSDIVVGNVVGSNIMNIAIIVGLSAAVRPIAVQVSTIRRQMPFAMLAGLAVWLFGLDGHVGRLDAAILLAGFVGFGWYCWRLRRSGNAAVPQPPLQGLWSKIPVAATAVLVGLAGLSFGADRLVEGAVGLALAFGVSQAIIGLTIVAAGTSLPELATSLVAAMRRQPDISIGNVVGSNVFNALLVLGTAAMISPPSFTWRIQWIDAPVMVGLSMVLVAMMISARRVSRAEGAALLLAYASYIAILLWRPGGW